MAATPDESKFGREEQQPGVVKAVAAGDDLPGCLCLQTIKNDGTKVNVYVWADDNGVLRRSTSYPTDQNSSGTAV